MSRFEPKCVRMRVVYNDIDSEISITAMPWALLVVISPVSILGSLTTSFNFNLISAMVKIMVLVCFSNFNWLVFSLLIMCNREVLSLYAFK